MRVFLTTDAVGGVWTYSIALAEELCRMGASVTLAILGPVATAAQRRRAASVDGLSLLATGLGLDWMAPDAGKVRQSAAALAGMTTGGIVHLHSPALAAFGDFARPVITCHSCIATWWQAVHGGILPPHLAWQRGLAAAGYAASGALLAPSAAAAAATSALYGVTPTVVHNGAAPGPLPQAPMGNFVFTSGRLWDLGKCATTLDAAAALLRWPVVAAGSMDGPDGEQIVLPHLRTPGWLGRDAVAHYLAQVPIFASAALYEPFGLSVLEAAQAGCPLVLSDIPAFRELWGDAAIYVAPHDAPGFAAAITALMQNPERRAARSEAARARARRYTASAMARATVAVYQTQLATA